ncbi:arginine deiminase family protein [Leifsonia sp. F6_8S_P_1B]|uniref:Arginine deiminase family protein n=1 Tax=Leifsonia williamsii TaxID=3035919 RepID=A0ABT8KFA2_9MICO|nr:dimethylargininase [Leifsonia williamsii]MDN4616130.1 arginine deiminase family protein [Leifsonia williamsii]
MTSSWGRRLVASLVSAVAVAASSLVVSVVVLLVANQLAAGALLTATQYMSFNALVALILAFAAALLGGLDRRWIAVVSGILVGLISVVLGAPLLYLSLGAQLNGQTWSLVWQSLISLNLPFWLAVAVIVPTAGYAVYHVLAGGGGTATGRKVALVRIPAANLADGLVTHIEREAIDAELADKQWDGYVAALAEHGWRTVEVASADRLADSVFVEDTAVVFGDTAVITRPGADSRKPETAGTEAALRAQGLRLERIEEPGTLEGGDVLKIGSTVYVGRGGRTNAEGIRQLRALVAPLGYTVVGVPVTKALHLKTAVTALPDGTVIGYEPLVDEPRLFERFLPVPEAHGTAVVVLDDETVLMSASAPQSIALIEDLGYTVVPVEISEFEKLEGCVTCLSIRVR